MNTVTISLNDYKELESKANQLENLIQSRDWVRMYTYQHQKEAAITFISIEKGETFNILLSEVNGLQRALRDLQEDYSKLEAKYKEATLKKPWYRRLFS